MSKIQKGTWFVRGLAIGVCAGVFMIPPIMDWAQEARFEILMAAHQREEAISLHLPADATRIQIIEAQIQQEERESAAKLKEEALRMGLPETATAFDVEGERFRLAAIAKYKLPESATVSDINFIGYLLSPFDFPITIAVGVQSDSDWDEITAAEDVRRKQVAKLLNLDESATLQKIADELHRRDAS